jgi:hypothetical protein
VFATLPCGVRATPSVQDTEIMPRQLPLFQCSGCEREPAQ